MMLSQVFLCTCSGFSFFFMQQKQRSFHDLSHIIYSHYIFIQQVKSMQGLLKNPNSEPFKAEVKFDRTNATYKPQEVVSGSIMLNHTSQASFSLDVQSIVFNIWGGAAIQKRQSKPQTEELHRRLEPITMIDIPNLVICKATKITQDTKLPFKFKLEAGKHKFLETYIGVYIAISYSIRVNVNISSNRKFQDQVPFYLVVPKAGRDAIDNFVHPKKKNFMVVSGEVKGEKGKVPVFKIKGQLESEIIYFSDDLCGSIVIDVADTPIRSIDLQMLRVEKVESDFRTLHERTEIQLIQICDGNVTRNMQIPLYMILPRYYSCPSVKYLWCSLNFEVNLQIIFKDGYKVLVNIPLKLIRN